MKQKHADESALALKDIESKDSDLKLHNASDEQLAAFLKSLSAEGSFVDDMERTLYQSTMNLLVSGLPEHLRGHAYYLVLAERISRYQVLLNRMEYKLLRKESKQAADLEKARINTKYGHFANEWRKCMELFGNQRWADDKKVKDDVVNELRRLRQMSASKPRRAENVDISTEARLEAQGLDGQDTD